MCFFIGFALSSYLNMVEELPDAFQLKDQVSPWGEEMVEVR